MGRRGTAAEPPEVKEDQSGQGHVPFLLRIGVSCPPKLAVDKELLRVVNDAIDCAISRSTCPADMLKLNLVLALADDTSRLIVKHLLNTREESCCLVCVLPAKEEKLDLHRACDADPAESRPDFDDLRCRAWRQIEPGHGNASCQWAQRQVALNCDVAVVIWDGKQSHEAGSTANLIHWLRKYDVDRAEPSPEDPVMDQPGPLRIIVHVAEDQEPYAKVDDAPPYDVAAKATKKRLETDLAGLNEFNRKKYGRTDWQQWIKQSAVALGPDGYPPPDRLKLILDQITPAFTRADRTAIHAQRSFVRYSYVLFGFTALATVLAALQAIVLTGAWELTFIELLLILESVFIVTRERLWQNNNTHWFVYRFFAERLRTAFYLLAVGRVPVTAFDVGGTRKSPTENDWVRRAFTAVLAEGDATTTVPTEDLETLSSLIRERWMAGQLRYFERTSKKMMRRHYGIVGLLYLVLVTTILAALLHSLRIWPFHSGQTQVLIMCAIGLPAVAAALSNIRSTREFSHHAFRYQRNAAIVSWYLSKFDDESSIKELGALAEKMGNLFTSETRGWLGEVSEHGLEIHG
jgi:hypothetical protein